MDNEKEQGKPSGTKRRVVKEIPSELVCLTDEDSSKFGMALEIDKNPKSKTYGAEFLVAQTVNVIVDDKPVVFDLNTLTVELIRRLCKNIGVVNCGSFNKFECRKALATFLNYHDDLHNKGLSARSAAGRLTSTIIRAVNVVFSDSFRDGFLSVNDRKVRRDHETRNTHKHFWYQAAMAFNTVAEDPSDIANVSPTKQVLENDDDGTHQKNGADEFSQLLNCDDDPHLSHLLTDRSINLMDFDAFETDAFRKKILDLFKIRRCMVENMSISGTHDNEAWNFIECAMAKTRMGGYTKVAVNYFYKQCEEIPGIDSHFQPFLDDALIGDTVSLHNSSSDSEESSLGSTTKSDMSNTTNSAGSARKKRKEGKNKKQQSKKIKQETMDNKQMQRDTFNMILEQGQATLQQMELSATREQLRMEVDAKKDRFYARLQVAQAMGDTEELRKLKIEANEF